MLTEVPADYDDLAESGRTTATPSTGDDALDAMLADAAQGDAPEGRVSPLGDGGYSPVQDGAPLGDAEQTGPQEHADGRATAGARDRLVLDTSSPRETQTAVRRRRRLSQHHAMMDDVTELPKEVVRAKRRSAAAATAAIAAALQHGYHVRAVQQAIYLPDGPTLTGGAGWVLEGALHHRLRDQWQRAVRAPAAPMLDDLWWPGEEDERGTESGTASSIEVARGAQQSGSPTASSGRDVSIRYVPSTTSTHRGVPWRAHAHQTSKVFTAPRNTFPLSPYKYGVL